jgi:hypothetical protein
MTLVVINNWISTGVTSIAATTTEKKREVEGQPSGDFTDLTDPSLSTKSDLEWLKH